MFPAIPSTIALQSSGGAVIGLFGLVLSLVVLAVWVYASYWVYQDARRRGSRHATAWGWASSSSGSWG